MRAGLTVCRQDAPLLRSSQGQAQAPGTCWGLSATREALHVATDLACGRHRAGGAGSAFGSGHCAEPFRHRLTYLICATRLGSRCYCSPDFAAGENCGTERGESSVRRSHQKPLHPTQDQSDRSVGGRGLKHTAFLKLFVSLERSKVAGGIHTLP